MAGRGGEYKLAIRIAGEIDKSLKESTNLTRKELNKLARDTVKASREANTFGQKLEQQLQEVEPVFSGIEKAGKAAFQAVAVAAGTATAAIGGVSAFSYSAGSGFESAFAGVKKTVDATDSEYAIMGKNIRAMAKEMPQTAEDLSAIAESAGQLGIEKENLIDFTKTMANMGVATNLSSEEAATEFARFANITQMSQKDFGNLGSTVVALGNNMATTEAEITAMSLRLGAAGKQVNMSESQIMGYAAALSSVGIEAEAGGSAFSKLIVNMQLAAETGSDSLGQYAAVAGMSAGEFKDAFQNDAAGAIESFIMGLSDAERNGKTAIAVLDDMGIKETRLRDTLLRAAGAGELFSDSLEIANRAWEENTALTREAEQRYQTVESQMQMLKNAATDAGISLYQNFREPMLQSLGVLREFAGETLGEWAGGDEMTEFARNLNKQLPTAIRKTKEFGTAVGDFAEPFLEVGGWLVDHPGTITGAITGIGSAIAGYKVVSGVTALTSALKALNSAGMAILGISGVTAVIAGISTEVRKASNEAKKASLAKHFGDISLSIEELDRVASHLVETQELRQVREALSAFDDLSDMQTGIEDAVENLNRMNWKISIGMELSEEENSSYQEEIQNYIEQVQNYAEQEQYAITMATGILGSDDPEEGGLLDKFNTFYASIQQELVDEAQKLRDAATEAFNDGLLVPEEAKIIAEIQQSMADIKNSMAGSEFDARLSLLDMEFSGQDLDADSFQNLQVKLGEYTESAMAEYQEAYIKTISGLDAMRKADPEKGGITQEEYDNEVNNAKEAYLQQKADMQARAAEFQINSIKRAYEAELNGLGPELQGMISSELNEIMTNDEFWNTYSTPEDWVNGLNNIFLDATEGMGLDASTRNALSDLFENMIPLQEEMETIKQTYKEAGADIPESLIQGMNDITLIGAAGGNEAAMWALIGNEVADNEDYATVIELARQRGGAIPEEVSKAIQENQEIAVTQAKELMTAIATTMEEGIDVQIPVNYKVVSAYNRTGEVPGAGTYEEAGILKGGIAGRIPGHAEGGIFTRPHLAWFAEDGPEAAIPINRSAEAIELWKQTGELLGMSERPDSFASLADTFIKGSMQDGQDTQQAGEPGGSLSITYSPVLSFYGDTDKEGVTEALHISQEEFAAYMEEYIREKQRRNFY